MLQCIFAGELLRATFEDSQGQLLQANHQRVSGEARKELRQVSVDPHSGSLELRLVS